MDALALAHAGDSIDDYFPDRTTPSRFVLTTIHRPENTDIPEALERVLSGLAEIDIPVLFLIHPRHPRSHHPARAGPLPRAPHHCPLGRAHGTTQPRPHGHAAHLRLRRLPGGVHRPRQTPPRDPPVEPNAPNRSPRDLPASSHRTCPSRPPRTLSSTPCPRGSTRFRHRTATPTPAPASPKSPSRSPTLAHIPSSETNTPLPTLTSKRCRDAPGGSPSRPKLHWWMETTLNGTERPPTQSIRLLHRWRPVTAPAGGRSRNEHTRTADDPDCCAHPGRKQHRNHG